MRRYSGLEAFASEDGRVVEVPHVTAKPRRAGEPFAQKPKRVVLRAPSREALVEPADALPRGAGHDDDTMTRARDSGPASPIAATSPGNRRRMWRVPASSTSIRRWNGRTTRPDSASAIPAVTSWGSMTMSASAITATSQSPTAARLMAAPRLNRSVVVMALNDLQIGQVQGPLGPAEPPTAGLANRDPTAEGRSAVVAVEPPVGVLRTSRCSTGGLIASSPSTATCLGAPRTGSRLRPGRCRRRRAGSGGTTDRCARHPTPATAARP